MRSILVSNFDQFGRLFDDDGEFGHQARNFVFRGQANSNWRLESTLERLISRALASGAKMSSRTSFVSDHLREFRQAVRGRRGNNPAKLDDIEAWALGQHFGLATPLLDWTASPYIALFFAFNSNEKFYHLSGGHVHLRSVWCLNKELIERQQHGALEARAKREITDDGTGFLPQHPRRRKEYIAQNTLTFVVPDIDENQRLIVQSGLFTFCPTGQAVDTWADDFLADHPDAIIRIDIEENVDQRRRILKALDLMNINHASLFPDISGACSHVNSVSEDFF